MAKVALKAQIRSQKRRFEAAVSMQRRWRGILGRSKYRVAIALKQAQEAAADVSATQLQARCTVKCVSTNGAHDQH